MKLRNLLIGMGLAGLLSSALADAPHVAIPANVDDVKQIMRQLGSDKFILVDTRRNFEMGNLKNPETAVDTDVYLSFFTLDSIDEHFAPVYANFMSQDYARKLLAALQTPAARISIRLDAIQLESGLPAAKAAFAKLSPSDQRAMNAFRRSDPFLSVLNAETNAKGEIKEMFDVWSKEVMHVRGQQVRKQLADLVEEEIRVEENSPGELATSNLSDRISRTGMRAFDQEARLTAEMTRQTARLSQRIARDNKQIDLKSALTAENMVTHEGLEAANLAILTKENMFDEHVKENDAISAEYDRGMNNIVMTAESRQKSIELNNQQMAQILDIQLRESERMRTFLELEKQILTFCESQLGKTKVQDGKLIFQTTDSAQTYNTLLAKIKNENAEIVKIEKEDADRRMQVAEKMRVQH